MIELPIDAALPAMIRALRERRNLVVVAPPGTGKSTRLPPALLGPGLLPAGHPGVVLLQPRRIAARAVAARIAQERGWELGGEVGYQVRFERRVGPRTRLRVVTEGVLTRQLLADPFLEGVGAVVLDEFHERSLHTDLALALLREVREAGRDDLRIVVMSATLDPGPIGRFLGEEGTAAFELEAPAFPVEIEYRPAMPAARLPERIAEALRYALLNGDRGGDVLVFLPGMGEIRACQRVIQPIAEAHDLIVLPLHGSLPAEEQDRALRPAGRRKVVLATNVAETSLTIEGVRTVIDSGLARYAAHDPVSGLEGLRLGRISRASARQRAGRAGRTEAGRCLRLWSPRDERGMAEFDEPEVRRADLAATVLALHSWGHADPRRFGWFEEPAIEALEAAERLLVILGALDGESGRITEVGRALLGVPAHPRIGRLLLAAAQAGRVEEGAALAALLSEKDILVPAGVPGAPARAADRAGGDSDLLLRLDLLVEAERRGFGPGCRGLGVDAAAARRVARARDELVRMAGRRGRGRPPGSGDDEAVRKLPLLAYPDRVCRRRGGDGRSGVMVGGRGVRLDGSSVVREAELFLALDPRDEKRGGVREAIVRMASAVRAEWLDALFPGQVRDEREAVFDPGRGKVVGRVTTRYRDLVLRQEPHAAVDADLAAATLAAALAPRALEILRGDEEAARLLGRIACLRAWRPDLGLPEVDEGRAAECLAGACSGCRSEAEVRARPLSDHVRGLLDSNQRRALEELAPAALRVPSGSQIRLAYEPGRPPVLAVRVQEVFGLAETPRVAGGQVGVLLHLLGPNYRPVQITDDLRSFWANTYPRVRKDLRARYPKHAWPEDPLGARPEAKGRPRPA